MDPQWPKHIATYYAQNSQEIPTQIHSGTESQNPEQSGENVEFTSYDGALLSGRKMSTLLSYQECKSVS